MARILHWPRTLPPPFRRWVQTGQLPDAPRGRFVAWGAGPPAVRPALVLLLLGWLCLPVLLGALAAIAGRVADAGLPAALAAGWASPRSALRSLITIAALAGLAWLLVHGVAAALWQRRHSQRLGQGQPSPFGVYLGETHLVSYAPVFRHAPRVLCVPRAACLGADLTPRRSKHGVQYLPTLIVRAPQRRSGVQRVYWPVQRMAVPDAQFVDQLQAWATGAAPAGPPAPAAAGLR